MMATEVAGSGDTIYPAPYAAQVEGRYKRKLANHFQLQNFGINLTDLAPGAADALAHSHSKQDEFFYVLKGEPTLIVDGEETRLQVGSCVGFPAGTGLAHQIRNDTQETVQILEVGDRSMGDEPTYPDADLLVRQDDAGNWCLTRKNGAPIES